MEVFGLKGSYQRGSKIRARKSYKGSYSTAITGKILKDSRFGLCYRVLSDHWPI